VFDTLKKNTDELNNVTLSRYALWSHDRPMQFFRASVSGYSAFIKYDDITVEDYMIVARSLDTLLLTPHPNFIKVDCEGADEHVLRGAEKILRKGVECITTEINYYINHKYGSSDRTLRDFMNSIGYDCFLLQDKQKPLFLRPDDTVSPTGRGLGIINAMFAKRERVEELWQYDCLDNIQQRHSIESFIHERSKSTPLMKERI
jgi:FkbM family methyltransferase